MTISDLEQIGSELGLKILKNPVDPDHISLYSFVADDFFMTTSEDDGNEQIRFYPYFRLKSINEKTKGMSFSTSSYMNDEGEVPFRIVYPIKQGTVEDLTKEDLVKMHKNLIMQVRTLKVKLKTDAIEKDFV